MRSDADVRLRCGLLELTGTDASACTSPIRCWPSYTWVARCSGGRPKPATRARRSVPIDESQPEPIRHDGRPGFLVRVQ